MIFENNGASIGQTQNHPHGQVYGVFMIPPKLERELETVILNDEAGKGCPFCYVREELNETVHQVSANTTWQAFLPPYVCYPYETHLYPRRHVASIAQMQDEELYDLAELLLKIVQGYNALFDGAMAHMPYLLGLHQLSDERFHFHIEILAIGRAPGKLSLAASSESIWGFWVNSSDPVQKSKELRDAIDKKSHYQM
jgi:UDPglucose--hexose-1-phosphate uridylyltransferase